MQKSNLDNEINSISQIKNSTTQNFILKSEFFKKSRNENGYYPKITNKRYNKIINYYQNTIKKNSKIFDIGRNELTTSKNYISKSNLNNQLNNNFIRDKLQQKNSKSSEKNDIFEQNYEEKKYSNYFGFQKDKTEAPLTNNLCNNIILNQYFLNMNNISSQKDNKQPIPPNLPGIQMFDYSKLIIKDNYSCLTLKFIINSNPNFANENLFSKISNQIKELCLDQYGNVFLQDLLDILTFENLNSFLNIIQPDLTEICISQYGARVIQKIIEKIYASPLLINKFIFILNNKDLGIICKAQYGNFIIQKYLLTIKEPEYINFIYYYISYNFLEIASSKYGVRVVLECINAINEIKRIKIYNLTSKHVYKLIRNEFGNYLIQYILINMKDERNLHEILPIIIKIEKNLVNLCMTKYSAIALENCLENSENFITNHIIDSLLLNNSNNLINIFFNDYGIYVLLAASKCKNGIYKEKIKDRFKKIKKLSPNFVYFNLRKNKNIWYIIKANEELRDIYKIIEKNINIMLNNTSNNK